MYLPFPERNQDYIRIKVPLSDKPCDPNEVRVASSGTIAQYIEQAYALLADHPSVTLKAMGKAAHRAVLLGEILRRRVPGLWCDVSIYSVNLRYVWEPKEGTNAESVETCRSLPAVAVVLSQETVDPPGPGTQAPVPEEELLGSHEEAMELVESMRSLPREPRGRGRGGERAAGEAGDAEAPSAPGRGQRRGGRGSSRGLSARRRGAGARGAGGKGAGGKGESGEGEGARGAPKAGSARTGAEPAPQVAQADSAL